MNRDSTSLVLEKKDSDHKRVYDTFYLQPKVETIINKSDTDDAFESIVTTVISNIQKCLAKGSAWIIGSFIEHNINISKQNLYLETVNKITEKVRPSKKRIDYYSQYWW